MEIQEEVKKKVFRFVNSKRKSREEKIIREERREIEIEREGKKEVKIENTQKAFIVEKEEDYIKLYLRHISIMIDLPPGVSEVLFSLLRYVNFKNQIVVNKIIKEEIAEETGKSVNTVNMYLDKLNKRGVLLRMGRGMYLINPHLFGKGSWKEIKELRKRIKISIEYGEENGKSIIKFKQEEQKPDELLKEQKKLEYLQKNTGFKEFKDIIKGIEEGKV